jgi:exo-beta-1,3-glucanase (GH17 family)
VLYSEGWRGIVTYSMDGTLRQVPRIAKKMGFTQVIAGLFWFDDDQLGRERAAALEEVRRIDGFVLGNEGLEFDRYSRQKLESELTALRADTGHPVTTTETMNQYRNDPSLLMLGDWVFPNIHPWFANIRSIPEAVEFVVHEYEALQTAVPGRTIVVKEAWWPTESEPAATEANQVAFFEQLAETCVMFIWGEAFDQFWKVEVIAAQVRDEARRE